MRFLSRVWLTSVALAALGASGCSPSAAVGSADVATGAARAPEVEVTVRMESELAQPERDSSKGDLLEDDKRSSEESPASLDQPGGDAAPPPPPPPNEITKNKKRKALEGPIPEAATADSAGAKVDSATIQQVIAKNVSSFKPCLRSDLALRLEATISPSGDVLEAHSARSFPDDGKARDCVVLAVKRLHFDRFDGGVPARVSFELTLKRSLDY